MQLFELSAHLLPEQWGLESEQKLPQGISVNATQMGCDRRYYDSAALAQASKESGKRAILVAYDCGHGLLGARNVADIGCPLATPARHRNTQLGDELGDAARTCS